MGEEERKAKHKKQDLWYVRSLRFHRGRKESREEGFRVLEGGCDYKSCLQGGGIERVKVERHEEGGCKNLEEEEASPNR